MDLCLHDYISFYAQRRPDTMFASDAVQTLSYREAWDKINVTAARLQEMGLSYGDRVGIVGKNSVAQLVVFLSCARIGVVSVGLNYRLTSSEISYIAKDAGAKCIFTDAEFYELLDEELHQLPTICLADSHDAIPTMGAWLAQSTELKTEPSPVELTSSDILFQMYTSGTTGLPKGALLTHNNVISVSQQASFSSGNFPDPGDRYLVIAPMFHAAGLIGSLVGIVYAASIVVHKEYDPVGMIETLANENIAGTTVVPVMLQFSIACVPNIQEYSFPNLKTISYGASPISEDLLRQSMEIFQCDFSQAYGQTETTAVITSLTKDDHNRALKEKPELLRSCGRPAFGTQVKIVDSQGNEVPEGEPGEVLVKGPQVMKGYWNLPEATEKTLVDGWLHTGDIGKLDSEGYVYLLDRVKDLIISGGENVYPVEVENVLSSHPEIQDVAVIGFPDEQWGEVPMAVLVEQDNLVSVEDIKAFCENKIAGFKIPKKVQYVGELPRNPTGKILKKKLREQLLTEEG